MTGSWVARAGLSNLILRQHAPALNMPVATELLKRTGALVREEIRDNEAGWLLDRDWLDDQRAHHLESAKAQLLLTYKPPKVRR